MEAFYHKIWKPLMYKKQHIIAEAYRDLGQPKKANRIEECSSRTFVEEQVDYTTGEINRKTVGRHRCHSSLCPICRQQKANYERFVAYNILPDITKEYKVLSITITMESCSLNQTREQIRKLHKVFTRLKQDKHFKKYIHGYANRIEWGSISEEGKINLHLHGLLFVRGSICGRSWVSSLKVSDLVQRYGDLDYTPKCEIHKVGNNNIQKTLNYIVKPQEIDIRFIKELDKQLSKSRLFSFGGIYKENRNSFIQYIKEKQHNIGTLYNIKNDMVEDFINFQ